MVLCNLGYKLDKVKFIELENGKYKNYLSLSIAGDL